MITKYIKQFLVLLIALAFAFHNCTKAGDKKEKFFTNQKNSYTLNIKIRGAANKTFYLYYYFGNKTFITDTVTTDNTGRYRIVLDSSYKSGLYKLSLSKNSYFNFIINHEDIELQTFIVNASDSMKVVSSYENQILYKYYAQRELFNKKMNLLSSLIKSYPQKNKFYNTCVNEFNKVQQDYAEYLQKLINTIPGSFVSKYILFNGFQIINPELSDKEQKQILIANYFNNSDFCDSVLLNSDAIPQKIITYLSLFNDRTKTQTQLEESYKQAVDNILNSALCNDQMFEFTLNYLIEGFEQLKYEEVLVYLSENYVSLISCVNENLKNNLEGKLNKYEKVSIGKIAPDFEIRTTENEPVHLYNIDSDYTLLLFWASWCPHCTKILSEIQNIYDTETRKKLEIIAISLDTEKEDWVSFLNNKNYNWINCSELKGWDSNIAIKYNIYATPSMILLDENNKIIAKPRTVDELKKVMRI